MVEAEKVVMAVAAVEDTEDTGVAGKVVPQLLLLQRSLRPLKLLPLR